MAGRRDDVGLSWLRDAHVHWISPSLPRLDSFDSPPKIEGLPGKISQKSNHASEASPKESSYVFCAYHLEKGGREKL